MPFKPMLAKDPAKRPDGTLILPFPLLVQPKLDGIRVHVQDGVALTRTLKRVPNAEVQAALGRPEFEGMDGEVIVGSPTADDCYRQTSSFVMSGSKTGANWTFYAFDIIDRPGETYTERRDELANRIEALGTQGARRPVLVAQSEAANADELSRIEQLMIVQGHEGAIARRADSAYKHGRSTPKDGPLWKIKRFTDFEAVVVGVFEEQHNGNDRFENELGRTARSTSKEGKVGKGTLGGLVVKALNGPWEGVEFRVGTGFDAQQRAALWAQAQPMPDGAPLSAGGELAGYVAKTKAFDVGSKDKPRHPVFLGWRDLGLDG